MTGATGSVPERLSLTVGETVTLTLPGLGGAGYLWQVDAAGGEHLIAVEVHRGGPGAGERVGAAGPETVRVQALARGRVLLRLAQRRPWERGSAPIASHQVEIVVE